MKCVRNLFFKQKYSLEVTCQFLAGGVGGHKVKSTRKFRLLFVQARTGCFTWGYYRYAL